MDIHVWFHHADDTKVLAAIATLSAGIAKLEQKLMATLDDLAVKVAAESALDDSIITLLKGVQAQVAALQPNQAAIDKLASDLDANIAKLTTATGAGTPTPTPVTTADVAAVPTP